MSEANLKTVVVSTNAGIPEGTTAKTPTGMPNLVVKTKSPLQRTGTRILRVYVNSFVGMLTIVMGNMAPGYLTPPREFAGKLALAAGFALAPAGLTLLSNLAEYLTREDAQ